MDDLQKLIFIALIIIAIILSPFALIGIHKAFTSDTGAVWTACKNSGAFTPNN